MFFLPEAMGLYYGSKSIFPNFFFTSSPPGIYNYLPLTHSSCFYFWPFSIYFGHLTSIFPLYFLFPPSLFQYFPSYSFPPQKLLPIFPRRGGDILQTYKPLPEALNIWFLPWSLTGYSLLRSTYCPRWKSTQDQKVYSRDRDAGFQPCIHCHMLIPVLWSGNYFFFGSGPVFIKIWLQLRFRLQLERTYEHNLFAEKLNVFS